MSKKIDLLLIDPPWYRFFGQQSSMKPLGLCYLAAVLEEEGAEVLIYKADARPGGNFRSALDTTANYQQYMRRVDDPGDIIWQDVRRVLTCYSPGAVGIGIVTAKYRSAVNLARLIKSIDPAVKIIAGGPHPTLCPEEVLSEGVFDIAVRGEGEHTVVEVVDMLKKQRPVSEIKGISYREGGRIFHNPGRELIKNLDSLPFPANHLVINQRDMLPDDYGYLMASRGCPYRCVFCAAYKIWGRRPRFRSPENVVAEIQSINKKYHPVYLHFQDDSFTLDKNFITGFCDRIKENKINIRWSCETRADLIDPDIARRIKKAGCFKVVLGAESGNEDILRKIKKHVTAGQIRRAVTVCKDAGMETSLFFMIGFPWETEREIMETIKFMEELDPQYAVFSVATPYPETELYRICQQQRLMPSSPDWGTFFHQSPEMFFSRKVSRRKARELIELTERTFCRHNKQKHIRKLFNPARVLREARRFYRQPKELLSKIRYILKK